MSRFKTILNDHIIRVGISARALAERIDMSYPTMLAALNNGKVPRKPEHREALRRELGFESDDWASIIAADGRLGVAIPDDGPMTLQQLVLKSILAQGYNESSFAKQSGIPYPTIVSIVAKGAIPRGDTLQALAEKLDVPLDLIHEAVAMTKQVRSQPETAAQHVGDSHRDPAMTGQAHNQPATISTESNQPHLSLQESPVPSYDESTPSLAQLAADAATATGNSIAAFARENGIPYVSLMKLINSGQAPRRKNVLDPLEKALGISEAEFQAALKRSKANPTPAEAPKAVDLAMNPFHSLLLKLVEDKKYTTKAFAEAADISVLTAAKMLKRGDLPGRQATHLKLRTLLGLSEADYAALIAESKAASEQDEEEEVVTTPGYVTVASGAAPVATTKGELFELLDRMSPAQLVALKQFLLTVL
jgi:predicted transcriptional regulator